MGSFETFVVGESFRTGSRRLDADLVASLVSAGGYTHPLFTDPAYLASTPFDRAPVPGEALLLLMGGLVEDTNRLDETTVALLGFDGVQFVAPAFVDDAITVEVTVLSKNTTSAGKRGVATLQWRCLNQSEEPLVDATAKMLFRIVG